MHKIQVRRDDLLKIAVQMRLHLSIDIHIKTKNCR